MLVAFHTDFHGLQPTRPIVSRAIEPRLSGKAWAPFRETRRNSPRDTNKISRERGDDETLTRYTTGVAELVGGRTGPALSNLAEAAENSNEPRAWNDLAAAYHEAWLRYDAPGLLAESLAAADRAITLDPGSPEALFNRALILEHLGLRDDARLAWQRYVVHESSSEWATEARSHLSTLQPLKPFLDRLDAAYDKVTSDPAVGAALTDTDPFGARAMGVVEVLGRWGAASMRGDAADADRHLRVARRLGDTLAARGGDLMLQNAVAAIDAADASTRVVLATAHAEYQNGMHAFQNRKPVDAESMIRHAANGFEQAHSPIALPARYFAACTVYEQGNRDGAEKEIESLMPLLRPQWPAWRAMLLKQLGNCHAARADWGSAIELLEQSAALFDELGETQNAAAVRRSLSFVYNRLDDPLTAWKYQIAALKGLGADSSLSSVQMLEKALTSIAQEAILRQKWQIALSFLDVQIEMARRIHDDLLLPDSLMIRAVVRDHLHDVAGAHADLSLANTSRGRSTDTAYAAYLRIAGLRASSMLSDTPPSLADTYLSEAITFLMSDGDRENIPGLLLLRARARRAAGNATGAMADLQRGITELEHDRQSLPEGVSRWGAFHSAENLFEEAVDLALSSNDVEAAFRFAERARARTLLENYAASPVLDYSRLPADILVVEYVSLPTRLIIFTVDKTGVRAETVKCDRESMSRDVDALSVALRHDDASSMQRLAAITRQRFIEPIAPQLHAATVVFVPDRATATIPFSALSDSQGRYLIEDHAIVIAPSAAAYAVMNDRRQHMHTPRSALVVSAPAAADDEGALVFADSEARRVSQSYPSARRLRDEQAQFDELNASVSEAEVIHFSGHAIGDDRGFEPASIVLRQKGHERRLRAAEVAALHLRKTSVVVLAGCSTGRGERRAAEGVISVAHGFLSAGSPSVIATLWPIADDKSAMFFPRLHRRLAEGLSPADALRETQREAIRQGDIPPSLWAAVQDIGS
jgi:CHAT domain-containing protein